MLMKALKHPLAALLAALALCSCSPREQSAPVKIQRLDLAMADYASLQGVSRDSLLREMSPGIKALCFVMGIDAASDSSLKAYSASAPVRVFTPDVRSRVSSLDSLERVLGVLKLRLKEKAPEIPFGEIYSIVSPYNQSVYMVDSTMLVALNHYLGSDYPGYSRFEDYLRGTKSLRYLPYDLVEALLGAACPYVIQEDATVLSRLLYEGALIEAKMQLLPDASLADALGYDSQQLSWARENEGRIWNAIVSRRLLYSTGQMDAERLVAPAPSTSIIHPEAPGRIGRYIGYSIVQAYLRRNPGTKLESLLLPAFYDDPQSLIGSGYAPGN